jgi:hypothetical protein
VGAEPLEPRVLHLGQTVQTDQILYFPQLPLLVVVAAQKTVVPQQFLQTMVVLAAVLDGIMALEVLV